MGIVQSLSGQVTELTLSQQEKTHAVKARLAELWSVPARCQRLIAGATVLETDEQFAECCEALPQGTSLALTFVYVPPCDGYLHKATLAHDADAVRILMQHRDRARNQKMPAGLMLLMNKGLGRKQGWPRIREALVDFGYTELDVDRVLDRMPSGGYCYMDALHCMLQEVGAIEEEPDFQRWWRTPPVPS